MGNPGGHVPGVAVAALNQGLDDAGAVRSWLVLTDFPFALHSPDLEAHAHDLPQQLVREPGGCVGDLPWVRLSGLVLSSQSREDIEDRIGLMDRRQRGVHMHHNVVPRGHDLAAIGLGGVPVR